MKIKQAWARHQLARALGRNLPLFLQSVADFEGDLASLARATCWNFERTLDALAVNTTLLSIDQVRDAFGDFLQTSYRSRRERVALTRTLDRIDQTALVFTDAHAQCLLVRVTDDARTHHVVGSGQRLCCVDPRTLVVAPHRAWLQLTPSKPAATP